MSSGAIPPAPPPAPPPGPASTGTVATAMPGPSAEALAKLPTGAMVTATVKAFETKTIIQVMTGSGEALQLKLPANARIPQGAELTFQLVQQGNLPALRLLAVNGRPLGAGAPMPGMPQLPAMGDLLNPGAAGRGSPLGQGAPLPGQSLPGQMPPGPATVQTPGQPPAAGPPLGLTATVVRPAGLPGSAQGTVTPGQPATPPPPPGLADLAPGTQLTVRIAGLSLPSSPGAPPPQQTGAPPPQIPPNPAALPQPQAATGQAQAPSPPPVPVPGQPASANPPPAQASPPMPPTPAATAPPPVLLSGTVIPTPPVGPSLVQTPAGLLSLPAGLNLPPGGTVLLEMVGRPVPPSPAAAPPPPSGLGPQGWPTLSAVADALAQNDRQALEQLIRLIPQANPRLAAAMSQFAGAVRSGDSRHLARDDVVKGLDKAGRRDLADRLKADFLSLTEESRRPLGGGEWQAITMPFAHGADIEPIRLYVQPAGEEDESGGRKGQEQRFILDVTMSRLGRIQFDGLVSRENKRFDLIVRTLEPLSSDIRRDIAGIFAECGQTTGIKGSVGFQSGRGFIDPPPTDATGTRIVV